MPRLPRADGDQAKETEIDTRTVALELADEVAMQQGEDIVILDVSGPLVIADYFVIATARNHRHAVSIARELERSWKARGERRIHTSGTEGESPWILLDFDVVVVHVFEEEARGFYALEALWGDAPRVEYTPPEVVPSAATPVPDHDADSGFDDEEFPGGRFTGTIHTEADPERGDDDRDGAR
jgi:ribosome-associated protein